MKKLAFISLAAIMASFAASADTIVTSKTYVDSTRQAKITPATTGTLATYNGQDANGGAVFSSTEVHSANTYTATDANKIPTMGAVMAQIQNSAVTLPTGTANTVVLYNNNGAIGAERAIATTLGTDTSATTLPTTGAVVTGLNGKQDNLGGTVGGASTAGKVVTATANAGTVGYTAIDTTVTDGSSNLVTSNAVYDAIDTVQTAVTALQNCTHTCADQGCTLITVSCVDAYQAPSNSPA